MAPIKKSRNTPRLPLALNPLKSKDVLAVLAERNQAIVPVGAWVEPASPRSSEIPASTSAYMIEEELKEQLRKKQEALKHFQRQVKHRVNQQIRLRKKQQLQKSYEAAEKEGSIAMKSSDPAHLTPKRTSVFPNNLNAAIGSATSLPSQMLGDGIEDRENQNLSFQQQAQALSQTMKQARHRLASFKIVSKKNTSVFPDRTRKSFPTQEEPDSEESSSIMPDKKGRENLFWWDQQDLLSEEKDIPFSRARKVQFKSPLFAVMEEEELKQLPHQGLQDILPETQDYLPEAQGDLLETQGDLTGVQSIELEAQSTEPDTQAPELEGQAVEPKAQATEPEVLVVKTETHGIILEAMSTELEDGSIMLDVQDFLPPNQAFLPKDQNVLPKCQDQDFLPKDQDFLPREQNILLKCQDQDSLPRYQENYIWQLASALTSERWKKEWPTSVHQYLLPRFPGQPSTRDHLDQKEEERDQQEKVCFKEPYSDLIHEKGRDDFSLVGYQYLPPNLQNQASSGDQTLYSRQQPSVGTTEKWRDLLLDGNQHPLPEHRREASSRRQVCDEYQSGLNTEFLTPLALQSGVDQEEDKKERQKQYLRYRRLFMDIEREQVKEQQRQKEHRKKIEKIKKKKEQQRYAEEQRMLRMNVHEEPYSGEKMSEMLAQLQLEEIKGAREKQRQREREYQRYVEALRAQIQEKMQLCNITLPPLCYCGPDFWDAHPDTCANNCIFYKNHRAYTRALHSVINSCDIPEGNSTLRSAIHNFASAHRRTLKNV
ncbi:coiled-coil domain containing 15 [Rhinolophus ferrumequinum]|uniref:Coiled-coil domain containing 15 n=1 Tax=Rhinolophus ferrumequinum TaxID=59479 RepID=A0A671EE79_RHIFE|nr:coiled-coil domain-containing protein 15 isoform X1 [Rhinolophus ferrumequinum]KAF6277697.1 coiled-coil domain containing 15 [Rhinolophus ferrumequinum]